MLAMRKLGIGVEYARQRSMAASRLALISLATLALSLVLVGTVTSSPAYAVSNYPGAT